MLQNGVTAMAWSTREIAELAGTSLRAVRHYHEVGLLAEPDRHLNGYKQYRVAHLVRVLQIKRMTDLGFSLSQVAVMGDVDDHPEQALRTLDAELGATIERLQRVRLELGLIICQAAPTDMPPEFASIASDAALSNKDRSMVVVATRVLGPKGLRAYTDMLRNLPADPVTVEFDDLPANADERTRQELAERLIPYVGRLRTQHPDLQASSTDAPRGARFVEQTFRTAIQDLYNSAQLDVVRRTEVLLRVAPGPTNTADDGSEILFTNMAATPPTASSKGPSRSGRTLGSPAHRASP